MDLHSYLLVLRKNWLLILLVTLVASGAATAYSLIQTPEYEASSTVFVSIPSDGTVSDLQSGSTFSQQRVKSYSELVAKPIVLDPVISELDLNISASALAAHVSASAPIDTALIDIAVTDADADRAAKIASAISASLSEAVDVLETPVGLAGTSPVKVTEVEAATVPAKPTSPNTLLNIAAGLLVGLALGLGIAIMRDALDARIRSERDVTTLLRRPIIGGMVFDPSMPEHPLVVHADPFGHAAESYRALRTNLQFLEAGETTRSFIVTSSVESEGKSTTIANLALSLADAGERVLLIDADLRRPSVAKNFGVPGEVGLTDVLIGRAEPKDVIQPWGQGGLSILTSGSVPPNPSELLGSKQMTALMSNFAGDYDVILLDVPPLLPVTDPAILSKIVSGTILVVAAGRTTKHQLRSAVASLDNVGTTVAGVVLTMLPTKGPNAQGYGSYVYGYRYASTLDSESV